MEKTTLRSTLLYSSLILLQSLLYGFGDPISKAAYEAIPVYSLLSLRYLIALSVLLIFAGKRIWRRLKKYPLRDWLLPSVCMALSYILNNLGLQLTAATSVSFLRSLSVVITPLLAWLVYRKAPELRLLVLLVVIVAGLYLLCGHGGLSGFGLGEIVSLLAALMTAGSLVFGETALQKMDALPLTATQAAVSAVIATACAFLFDGGIRLSLVTPSALLTILYLAVVCTIFGYLLQNLALGRISDRTVALLQCSCPVFTAVFSFFLLGEVLSPAGKLGAGLILLGVAAATIRKQTTF